MSTAGKETTSQKRDPPASTKPARPPREKSSPSGPATWAKVLGSLFLVWHLFWVFVCPLANSSKVNFTIASVVSHWLPRLYTDPLCINVGYGFFSPDPPFASAIIKYKVFGDDGRVLADGQLPDADRMFPRLRYHRHKMLADQGVDTMLDERRPEFVLKGYARHLIRRHGGERAEVTEIAHEVLPHDKWLGDPGTTEPGPNGEPPRLERKGLPLDDPSTYHTIRTVTQTRRDIETIEGERQKAAARMETVAPGGPPS
jgi:hypothetical protein